MDVTETWVKITSVKGELFSCGFGTLPIEHSAGKVNRASTEYYCCWVPIPPVIEKNMWWEWSMFDFPHSLVTSSFFLQLVPTVALSYIERCCNNLARKGWKPLCQKMSVVCHPPQKLSAATSSLAPYFLSAVRWIRCSSVTGCRVSSVMALYTNIMANFTQELSSNYHRVCYGGSKGNHHENSLEHAPLKIFYHKYIGEANLMDINNTWDKQHHENHSYVVQSHVLRLVVWIASLTPLSLLTGSSRLFAFNAWC